MKECVGQFHPGFSVGNKSLCCGLAAAVGRLLLGWRIFIVLWILPRRISKVRSGSIGNVDPVGAYQGQGSDSGVSIKCRTNQRIVDAKSEVNTNVKLNW